MNEIYENILKKLREFYSVDESKNVGVIYHFTRPDYFSMMLDKTIQKKNLGVEKEFVLYSPRGGVSATRNFNLAANPSIHNDISINKGYFIRIAIDGTRLSDHYKIQPLLGLSYNEPDLSVHLDTKRNASRMSRHTGEAEELIIAKQSLVDIKGCIIRVDFIPTRWQNYSLDWIELAGKALDQLNIPFSVAKNFQPVRI